MQGIDLLSSNPSFFKISEEHYLEVSHYYDHEIKYKSSFSKTTLICFFQYKSEHLPQSSPNLSCEFMGYLSASTPLPHPQPTHAVRFRQTRAGYLQQDIQNNKASYGKNIPHPKGKSSSHQPGIC